MQSVLTGMIDRINELQLEKKKLAAQVKELGKEIDTLSYNVLQSFDANDITGLKTEEAKADLIVELFPKLESKEDFFTWAVKEKRWEMIPARTNKRSVLTFFDESGKMPDGLDVSTRRTIKIKELKK